MKVKVHFRIWEKNSFWGCRLLSGTVGKIKGKSGAGVLVYNVQGAEPKRGIE